MKTFYAAIPKEGLSSDGRTASLESYLVITESTHYLWLSLKEIDPSYIPAIIEFSSTVDPEDLVEHMEETDNWEVNVNK